MTSNSKNQGERRNGAAVLDEEIARVQDEGRAAHEGDQAPPNADDGGRTIAPQKGDPRTDDRRPG